MDLVTRRLSRNLAVAALAAWVLLVALLWFARTWLAEETALSIFLGRFHILIVHLPIGLLVAALVFELLDALGWSPGAGDHVVPSLWLASLGAVGSTAAGYLLMTGQGIEGKDMVLHMWTGFAVVLVSFLCLWFKLADLPRLVTLPAIAATVALTGASSHFGGNMVHGNDYLSEYAPDPLKPLLGHPAPKTAAVPDLPREQWPVYERVIQPIFDAKCTECHDENKIEGGLRMDSFAELAKGGDLVENGDIPGEFIPGDSEKSELVYRVTLDPSEDDFMPPGDREALTEGEIALLRWWIDRGASPTMTVSEAKPDESVLRLLDELASGPQG
jgi:hypothetical protein